MAELGTWLAAAEIPGEPTRVALVVHLVAHVAAGA